RWSRWYFCTLFISHLFFVGLRFKMERLCMSWDKNTKPKRLRKKQKRFLMWLTFAVSLVFVSFLGIFDDFKMGNGLQIITDVANSILSDEEKRVVWDGMSEDGKDVLRKHIPVSNEGN
ncbi:MAG: hypothetical protein R8M45_05265, partial [Ghiorsea sp.]